MELVLLINIQLGGKESAYDLQKVSAETKVLQISVASNIVMYQTEDGVFWCGNFDEGTQIVNLPKKIDLSSVMSIDDSVLKIESDFNFPQIITAKGKLLTYNMNRNRKWEVQDIDVDNQKVIDNAIQYRNYGSIALKENGEVYGCGPLYILGINETNSTERNYFYSKLPLDNISQVVAGNGWFIAVSKDGKVYGIGSNNYGILGRWIGVDRKSPNSRYKTPYLWVECPELEI